MSISFPSKHARDTCDAVVSVLVNQARGLPATDVGGGCDPYVVASINDTKVSKRTQTVRKSHHPVWNARLNLVVPTLKNPDAESNQKHTNLLLQVLDYDMLSNDDLIGSVSIDLETHLKTNNTKFEWLALQDTKGAAAGEIQVMVICQDVGVLRCDLDLARFSHHETISLRLSFGRRSFETSKKAISNILDWNEKMSIWMNEDTQKTYVLMVRLIDSGGRVLASSDLSIQQLLRETDSVINAECMLSYDVLDNDAELGRLQNMEESISTHANQTAEFGIVGKVQLQVSVLTRLEAESRLLKKILRDYDEDAVGSLSQRQFTTMLADLDMQLDNQVIQHWFEAADTNGDQRLSTAELSDLLRSACFESLGVLPHLLSFDSDEDTLGMIKATSPCRKGADGSSINRTDGVIYIRDRKSGVKVSEKIPSYLKFAMRAMFGNSVGTKLTTTSNYILKKMSKRQGKAYNKPSSASYIPEFIKLHNLDTTEIEEPLESFKTFNEFFSRSLKASARPLASPNDDTVAVSPADSRIMVFPTMHEATKLWIKGNGFTLERLLGPVLADPFLTGSLVIARLAPQDYHRWHMPISCEIVSRHDIAGALYTVNPFAINSTVPVFQENKRCIVELESKEFGRVVLVAVGATMVGSMEILGDIGDKFRRGDEHGKFLFGGSTVILLFENDRIQFDSDLLLNSSKSVETLVRVRSSIGCAAKRK